MPDIKPNPLWTRGIPTGLAFLAGLSAIAVGVMAAVVIAQKVSGVNLKYEDFERIGACLLLYFRPGFFRITSGILFYQGRMKAACFVALIGALTPILLISVMGV